jgi:hypothetical protein
MQRANGGVPKTLSLSLVDAHSHQAIEFPEPGRDLPGNPSGPVDVQFRKFVSKQTARSLIASDALFVPKHLSFPRQKSRAVIRKAVCVLELTRGGCALDSDSSMPMGHVLLRERERERWKNARDGLGREAQTRKYNLACDAFLILLLTNKVVCQYR